MHFVMNEATFSCSPLWKRQMILSQTKRFEREKENCLRLATCKAANEMSYDEIQSDTSNGFYSRG